MSDQSADAGGVSRRTILRLGAVGGAGVALVTAQGVGVPFLAQKGLLSADGAFAATSTVLGDQLFYLEVFPTSPLIISPFSDELLIPKALAPEPISAYSAWANPPGPAQGQQNSLRNQQHQMWPNQIGCPDPVVYKIDHLVRTHAFTTSQVLPIDSKGHSPQPSAAAGRRGSLHRPARCVVVLPHRRHALRTWSRNPRTDQPARPRGRCIGTQHAAHRHLPAPRQGAAATTTNYVRTRSLARPCGGDRRHDHRTRRKRPRLGRRLRKLG